ncbi:MAG: Wzz/FepE/Etk N-terminal domain-containing protein [Bacteroidia bacterium]|nr:Wzz/FepE/Etk N-terminal domain-containing protein [Bacteroidia bacterium]
MSTNSTHSKDLISAGIAEKSINFIDVLNFFWRWRKYILITVLASGIIAAVFSSPLFMTPKYKATHILYPTTNNSVSNALLTELNQRQKDPLELGGDEEAEKALQVLQSSTLMNRLVKNFGLMEHYNIDPKGGMPQSQLADQLKSNISFNRTRYLSVEINVMDESPEMAAKIANGIASLYDTVKTEIQKQIAVPALQIVERALQTKRDQITDIKKRLQVLGNKGIINYEEQTRALSEEIYKAQAAGRKGKVIELKKEKEQLIENGGEYMALNELIQIEETKKSDLISQLDKRTVDVTESLSHKFTVSEASAPERKAWPIRSLIVLLTMVTAFAGTSLVLLGVELFAKDK